MDNGDHKKDRKTVSLEELVISNMYEIQAVINLLEEKGLLDKKEVLGEVKRLSKKQ